MDGDEDTVATILRAGIGLLAALLFVAAWILVEHFTDTP